MDPVIVDLIRIEEVIKYYAIWLTIVQTHNLKMSDNAKDVLQDAAAAAGGSLFSTFDIVMLVVLLGAAVWWLYSSRKENKKDEIVLSKYSIQ